MFGRSRLGGHDQRFALNNPEEFDETKCEYSNRHADVMSLENRRDYERAIGILEGLERAIVILRYEWGFKETEVAHCFGVTESQICKRLTGIQARLSRAMAREEPREGSRIFETEAKAAPCKSRSPQSRQCEVARLGSEKRGSSAGLARESNDGLEEEEPFSMESSYEASFDEWLT